MDVMSLLLQRIKYPLRGFGHDTWLDEVVESNDSEVSIILTENTLNKTHVASVAKLRQYFHLKAFFNITNPYVGTNFDFILYVFTKDINDEVLYGVYNSPIRTWAYEIKSEKLELCEFPDEYLQYLNEIDEYLSTGICPKDTNNFEFGKIPLQILNDNHWNPNSYKKAVLKALSELHAKETVCLGDIAKIIEPRRITGGTNPLIALPINWQYPLDIKGLDQGVGTNCPLEKGDIIILNYNHMFLFYDNQNTEIHTSPNCIIIRPICNDFCSEYLYLYLNSKHVQTILESERLGTFRKRLRAKDLENIPVMVPDRENAHYKYIFYSENFPYSYLENNQTFNKIKAQKRMENDENAYLVPYIGDKEYIFISYSHKDKETVLPIIRKFFENGYRIWYDEGIDPGTEWDKNIADHIMNCGFFIACMSNNYLNSSNCKDELNFARDLEKSRFLIYIEKTELPPEMQMRLSRTQNIHKYTYEYDQLFFDKLFRTEKLHEFIDVHKVKGAVSLN